MARKKQFRWDTLHEFDNTLNEEKAFALPGRWHSEWFQNDLPIVLELACGKGDYANGLAQLHPDKNFIGIDLKGDRIWLGAQRALQTGLGKRVSFLRGRIDFLEKFFAPGEVSDIWITFPDPQARKSTIRKRLTAPGFLDRYKLVQQPGSVIHLKTDTELLYQYTHEILNEYPCEVLVTNRDIYAVNLQDTYPELAIKTAFELKHLEQGRKIKYVKFRLK